MAIDAKVARCSDTKDRLSALPDDILIQNIMPLLPTKEAARTSILSHRWRFLWSYVPCLGLKTCATRKGSDAEQLQRSKYVHTINQVIRAYRGRSTLRHFRVSVPFEFTYSKDVDSWLDFALGKGTEELELNCCWLLQGCVYKFPPVKPCHFPNLRLLKSLTLKVIAMSTDSLNDLLLRCEFLERLQIYNIIPSSSTETHIKITGPISRLKYIHFLDNRIRGISVTISAPTPHLVSFIYPDSAEVSPIKHAPQLVDLFIGGLGQDFDLLSHPYFRYVSQLQVLRLAIPYYEKLTLWLPRFPDLSGLKHLEFKLNFYMHDMQPLHGMISLVNAAPNLQRLKLDVENLAEHLIISEEASANLRLKFLRVIKIVEFRGRGVDWQLAAYLTKSVSSSEKLKLIINCCKRQTYDIIQNRCYSFTKRTMTEFKTRALELKRSLPSNVKVVVT